MFLKNLKFGLKATHLAQMAATPCVLYLHRGPGGGPTCSAGAVAA